MLMFFQNFSFQYICKGSSSKHQTEKVIPKPGLGDVYSEVNKTFKILNQV